jgi:hypothetical protein
VRRSCSIARFGAARSDDFAKIPRQHARQRRNLLVLQHREIGLELPDGRSGIGVLQARGPQIRLLLREIRQRAFHVLRVLYRRDAVPQLDRHTARRRS